MCVHILLGLARTIYIRCIYSFFGREITKYTVIYGVYIRFWPTLNIIYIAGFAALGCTHKEVTHKGNCI